MFVVTMRLDEVAQIIVTRDCRTTMREGQSFYAALLAWRAQFLDTSARRD